MLKPSRVLGLTAAAAVGAALVVPTIAAPAWFSAKNLSASGQNAAKAQVAVDSSGNVIAVWERSNGVTSITQAARYHGASNTWSSTTDLSAVGQSAVDAQVAVDSSGNAIAVWERFNGSYTIVQASRFDAASGTWGAVADLSATGQHGDNPQIAFSPSGDAIAVWSRGGIIQGATYDAVAGTWGAVTDLSVPGQPATDPQIAFSPTGDAIGVWERSDGSNTIMRWAKYTGATKTWGTTAALSASGQNSDNAHIVFDASGNALAVWQRSNGSHTIARGARYIGAANTWGATEDLSASGQNAQAPSVAMDGSGNAIAVWERSDGANTIAQAARFTATTNLWSAAQDLSAPGQNAARPRVAFDGGGNAVAVWERSDGSNTRIQSARFKGGAWTGAGDISSAGGDAARATVAVDADGNAVAVWERSDGVNTIIQRAFLDGVAPSITALNVPASGGVGQALPMSIEAEDRFGLGSTTWDFGDGASVDDGGTATLSTQHAYAAAGTYTVTVTQRDSSGEAAVSTAKVVVDGGSGGSSVGPQASRGAAPTPQQAARLRCAGRPPTIVGTQGRDVINGTRRADVIIAFGGNDVVRGRGGNDRICLGAGNDRAVGGRGADRILGENGNDRLDGSAGNDRLIGGRGRDVALGRNGNDRLDGGSGNDRLLAGAGNDVLLGRGGRDYLAGGAGRDRLLAGGGNDRLFGNGQSDILNGGAGRRDVAHGGGSNDRCIASEIRRSC